MTLYTDTNYTALLGVSANLRLFSTVSLQGGIGLGGWGSKYSIGIKYSSHYNGGWYYGLGFSNSPGEKNVKVNMQISTVVTQSVTIDYLKESTLNFKVGYDWIMGMKNIFYLEFGYALPLQTDPWRVTDGSSLSATTIEALRLDQPGGLIIGLGFTFGINSY